MHKSKIRLTKNGDPPTMSIARSVLSIYLLALHVGIGLIACTHLDR